MSGFLTAGLAALLPYTRGHSVVVSLCSAAHCGPGPGLTHIPTVWTAEGQTSGFLSPALRQTLPQALLWRHLWTGWGILSWPGDGV